MQEMPETWVQSLGQEYPLEEEMAFYSSILAWEIPWTEKPGGLWYTGHKESNMTEHTPIPTPTPPLHHTHTYS